MKIKRMAAVAAAAVVGPVLLTTPALAGEHGQSAVTVPDAEPKDDAQPAAGQTAQTEDAAKAKTEAEANTGAGTGAEGAAGPSPAGGPSAPTPAVPQSPDTGTSVAPAVQTPAEAVADTPAEDPGEESPTGILMGPDVSVRGIPKTGFKADGSWTPLTVQVDNSGHIAVANYTPEFTVMQWDGKIKASQVKVEQKVTAGDGSVSWQPVKAVHGPQYGPGIVYRLGTTASVAVDAVYTVDVRVSFAADTPVVAFDIASDGKSRIGGKTSASPSAWYNTAITGATPGSDQPVVTEGPDLTIGGLPAGLAVGGAWQDLTIHVDNSGKPALDDFHLYFSLARPDWVGTDGEQLQVEVYGKNGWERAELGYSDGYYVVNHLAGGKIPAGKAFDVKVRIRFTADTPLGYAQFRASGTVLEIGSDIRSDSRPVLVKILPAAPDGGNRPAPNGGTTTPISTTNTTGTATGGTGAAAGELAATGADTATSWALAGGGVALAMGAALVAGTGRRRRTTA
ncbi:LPXTG cell wall anchor domain-containing protein [Streptomyces venezuelae]|uniref:LPXTG cell wall anchor domain-containing protein n=1 Tax=Streptomyces venezuelae TaxID=54571 RepID=UPI0033204FF9